MTTPTVSVIIPAYNGAEFLAATIQSVLDQTYSNFELIVVDDASTDDTSQVVQQFDDPRVKFIQHQENQGSDVARHTGLQASSGEIIAFLDQDDLFHPEKLEAHVALLERQPDVGFTYNARFELNHSSETVREIWRPPRTMTLAHLVYWFPLSPSDVVLRRKWALQIDLLGGTNGAEIFHFGRLFLEGCKFASVDRALNYRRYHSGRKIKNLAEGCQSELDNQSKIFADPRCTPEVLALQDVAHSNIYVYWSYIALVQEETALGQRFVREATRLKPALLEGMPCELVIHLLANCIDDETQNHEILLERVLAQLPPEMARLSDQHKLAVGLGYLMKGARAIIWDRPDDGRRHFEQAAKLRARVDEFFLGAVNDQLLNYEAEFGPKATQDVLRALIPHLEKVGGQASVRQLQGLFSVNHAFHSYSTGAYTEIPLTILRAIASNPRYLVNRGTWATLLRSIMRALAGKTGAKQRL